MRSYFKDVVNQSQLQFVSTRSKIITSKNAYITIKPLSNRGHIDENALSENGLNKKPTCTTYFFGVKGTRVGVPFLKTTLIP